MDLVANSCALIHPGISDGTEINHEQSHPQQKVSANIEVPPEFKCRQLLLHSTVWFQRFPERPNSAVCEIVQHLPTHEPLSVLVRSGSEGPSLR
jgi:hypothetical protein